METLSFDQMQQIQGGQSTREENWDNGICYGYLHLMIQVPMDSETMDVLIDGFMALC